MDNIEQYINPTAAREQLGIAPAELQNTLKLAGLLQTSLEIDSVLNYFLQAAQQIVNFDAADFSYEELSVNLKYGKVQRHSCSYRLRLAGEYLGELVFTRRRRFAETEMEHLENLMGQLIYPLRNAIWYQKAVQAAKIDPLTGSHNRTALDEFISREIDLAKRSKTAMSIILLDLDHFKNINDSYGHTTGDEVLREFVQCCQQAMRSSDMIFRYGGEEFVILLPGVNALGATQAAERIRTIIEKHHFSTSNAQIPVTVSMGTASLMITDTQVSIINRADKALYAAKHSGRNRVISDQDLPATEAATA